VTYVNTTSIVIIACKNCYSDNRVVKEKRVRAKCGKCGWRLIPPAPEAVNFFIKTLIGLSARLNALRRSLGRHSVNVGEVERELNTCNALLHRLYSHAYLNNIDLHTYFQELSEIEFFSRAIEDEIELKTQKRATWKQALNASIKVTNFILMLLGLPTFLHLLPEGLEPRLIEDGSRKKRNR
jgi:hypothetical protein